MVMDCAGNFHFSYWAVFRCQRKMDYAFTKEAQGSHEATEILKLIHTRITDAIRRKQYKLVPHVCVLDRNGTISRCDRSGEMDFGMVKSAWCVTKHGR